MKRSVFAFALGAAVSVLAGLAVWAHAGDLNPPAGPVAPTMRTLDQISADISALQGATGGVPIKRVIHGVVTFDYGAYEKTQTFSPSIDPAKAVVTLSPAVAMSGTLQNSNQRNGACLVDLTSTNLKIALDQQGSALGQQVSFQIIEYN